MKQSSLVQMVVAAVLVVLGGLALAFDGEEAVRLVVEQKSGDEVTVKVNGDAQTVKLQDLKDGESKSFPVGEHTLTVKRTGDELAVSLDGDELCGGDGEGKAEKVMVLDDGEPMMRKRIVVVDGDEPDASAFKYHISTDDDGATKVKVLAIGGDDELAIPFDTARADRVRFRCAEDGTTLAIAKDKATQESYVCPVCGRPMEKVAQRKVKVMTVVAGDDEECVHGPAKPE